MTPPAPAPSGPPRRAPTMMTVFSKRLLSHGSIYAFTGALGFVSLIVQIVILTRLLEPGAYGDLALLLLYGTMVSFVVGLAVSQGTVIAAFVGGDEEGFGDEVKQQPVTDNRGVLMTGVLVTVVNGTILLAVSIVAARPIASLLVGDADRAMEVIYATAYGGLGPAWRLVGVIPRFERRPLGWLWMQTGSHIVTIGCAAALAAAGYGTAGVMVGLTLGRVVSILIGIAVGRHRFRRTFQIAHAKLVFRNGMPYVGLVLAFFFSRNIEIYVLSQHVRGEEIGVYQVATRLALIPAFALSATLMAWGPLMRGPIRAALQKTQKLGPARDRVVTYYFMMSTWILVASLIIGHLMVRIAPDDYRSASKVLPLLTLGTCLHAATMLVFRMYGIKGGIRRLRNWALTTVPLMVIGAVLIIPYHGAIGAAAVNAAIPLIGFTVIYLSARQQKRGPELSGRQVASITLIGLACVAAARLAELLPDGLVMPVEVGLVVAFPLLLLVTGVFPHAEARQLVRIVRPSTAQRLHRRDLRKGLGELSLADFELLEALVRHKESPQVLAERLEISEIELCERMIAVLRRISATGEPGKHDAGIGRALLTSSAQTKRDLRAYQLTIDSDVNPIHVDRLGQVMSLLGSLRGRAWDAARPSAPPVGEPERVTAQ